MTTSPKLQAELLRVEGTDASSIVLDPSGLRLHRLDGVKVIVDADARSRADSNRLVLRGQTRSSAACSRSAAWAGDWPAFND